MTKEPIVFVRKASGLRRDVGTLSVLSLNALGTTYGIGIIFLVSLSFIFPGGDPTLATLITIALVVPQALVYGLLAIAMPRSGGDYIFVSRIVHPAIGFAENFSMSIWYMFYGAIFTMWTLTFGFSPAFAAIGSVINNQSLIEISSLVLQPNWIMAIGTVILILGAVLTIFGNKFTFPFLNLCMILGVLGVVIVFALLAGTTTQGFVNAFNQYSQPFANDPDYYHTILTKGQELGYVSSSFSWAATVGIIPLAAWALVYLSTQSYVAGEIKNVTKNNIIGPLVGGAIISGIVMAVGAYLMTNVAGLDFINSLNLAFYSGEYALPAPPWWNLLGSMLTQNLPLLILIGIGFVAWCPMVVVADFVLDSRNFLAWAFDRIIPEKFSYVHPRTRTPIVSLVTYLVGAWIVLALVVYLGSIFAALSATLAQLAFTFIPTGIAAVLLPLRQRTKRIYESSPIKYEIAGIPAISILGVIQIITMGWLVYMFATNSAYAANTPGSLIAIVGVFVAGLVIYYVSLFLNKRRGIDLSLSFRELPPA